MNNVLHLWPYVVMAGTLIALLVDRSRRRWLPMPWTAPQRVDLTKPEDTLTLAGMIRSSTYYVTGSLPDWERCEKSAEELLAPPTDA